VFPTVAGVVLVSRRDTRSGKVRERWGLPSRAGWARDASRRLSLNSYTWLRSLTCDLPGLDNVQLKFRMRQGDHHAVGSCADTRCQRDPLPDSHVQRVPKAVLTLSARNSRPGEPG
jgi:hypothetical protein